ncbi:hypothetical protein C2S51_018477 [Perilla frutescens var. frutescens]|nr:hypothetical protein C2S51_018477 [Perilla frutescens var. frutescens]
MASFAAVISLKHTIKGLKYKELEFALVAQIKSANEQLEFLGNILTRLDGSSGSSINRSVINALDVGIREAWLPADGNGRRILLTTRLEEVAKCHGISTIQKIRFLNNEESWNLLWQNVFVDKSFPPQLEKSGRKIAEICEGLPLLILVVANILRGLDKTEEYWKKVAEKKTTTFTDAYDQISKVLSLSYDYLPQRLKVCFLYMGAFPQSCKIPAPKLINLWIVEDFLEPIEDLDLEEINYHEMDVPEWHYEGGFRERKQRSERFGMECLKGLVSHSLAIVCKQSSDNRIKSSKLHSAYWYMCIKEARKNKFFHVLNKLKDDSIDYMQSQRRLSVQNNILFGIKEVYDSVAATLTARSLLCTGEDHQYPVPICLNLMLLKVLDALSIRFYEFPTEVVNLLQLRYLALTHNGKVPSSISKLQQLECLILRQHHNITLLRHSTCLPPEIWNLQELQYLRITGSNLPSGGRLSNLLTLYVNANSCTRNVFRGTANLKKLGIKIELQPDAVETLRCLEHIGLLKCLKSLKCVVVNPRPRSQLVVAPPDHLSNLPGSLKKLSLNGLGYSWKYTSSIGSLPNLKVLKLRCSAFQGAEWETEAGQFRSLKFLLLEDMDLVHWTIENDKCFPCLQGLIIGHCYKLKEIPRGIGAIPTLKTIEVVDCSPSVVASAHQIKENRKSSVKVVINSSWSLKR